MSLDHLQLTLEPSPLNIVCARKKPSSQLFVFYWVYFPCENLYMRMQAWKTLPTATLKLIDSIPMHAFTHSCIKVWKGGGEAVATPSLEYIPFIKNFTALAQHVGCKSRCLPPRGGVVQPAAYFTVHSYTSQQIFYYNNNFKTIPLTTFFVFFLWGR